MADRPTADALPANRLRILIDRSARHLTPQEANALRGAFVNTMRNATTAVAELHQQLAEQAADLERARRIAVRLENETARLKDEPVIDTQVTEKADRVRDLHRDAYAHLSEPQASCTAGCGAWPCRTARALDGAPRPARPASTDSSPSVSTPKPSEVTEA